MSKYFSEKFKKGLIETGIKLEEFDAGLWYYVGGNNNQHYNYWKIKFPNKPLPSYSEKCICGQSIKENCYIFNGKDIKILGSCCIERFIPNGISRTCSNCGESHNNRRDNLCSECRIDYLTCKVCGVAVEKDYKLQKYIICDECQNKDKIYLNVPFSQKEQAKSLGARFDPINKKWYAPYGEEILIKYWGDYLFNPKLSLFNLGAIELKSSNYVLLEQFNPKEKYGCLKCESEICLKKCPNNYIFSHKNNFGCSFYENPEVLDCILDCKYKLANIISNQNPLSVISDCPKCSNIGLDIELNYDENDEVIIDYKLMDTTIELAVLNKNTIKYLFCFKKPDIIIPEPWFLIDYENFYQSLENYKRYNQELLIINCQRKNESRKCRDCYIKDSSELWLGNLPKLTYKWGSQKQWKQDKPCLICKTEKYSPVFSKSFKAICKMCFNENYESLKEKYSKIPMKVCLID